MTEDVTAEEYAMYHGISMTDVLRHLHIIGDPKDGAKSAKGLTVNGTGSQANNDTITEYKEPPRNARALPKDDQFFQPDPRSHAKPVTRVKRDGREQILKQGNEFDSSKKSKPNVAEDSTAEGRMRRDIEVTTDSDDVPMTSEPPVQVTTMSASARRKVSRLTKPHPMLFFVDIICYCFFTIEIIIRFIFCDSKIAFFKDMFNVVDLIAILPFYVEIIVNSLYREEQFKKSIVDVLLFTRILRIFRIFRLIRRHRGLQILVYTIRASMKEIMLLLLFVIIGTILFSSLVYYADEGSGKFKSIPHSFWWAVITMTTVGYGDMYPVTPWGWVIGAGCSVSGVLLIAFTVPVIVNNFLLIYRYVQFQRDRPDPEEVEFREKWEKKMMHSAESTLRLAAVSVHVDNEDGDNGNNINAV